MAESELSGVHHVTIPVTDLDLSIQWYEACLAAQRIPRFDHHGPDGKVFAAILRLPGPQSLVQLRADPDTARSLAGFTPVTFAVADRAALEGWLARLDAHGIAHSAVTSRRIGDSADIESPDGLVLRLYTDPVGGVDAVEFTE
jgi:catechol 2,3-dioxygenase-like lactoylglutathione lyase family enzyme